MPGPDIRLNSQLYSLSTREDGTKIVTRPVQQFVQSIKDTGRTRPEDVSPYETFIHPNLTYGFGRYRINSDAAFSAREYRKCWDSTCETRWPDGVYLPILSQDSVHSGLEVVRASAELGAETNALWEKDGIVVNKQFTGSTITWENGGDLNPTINNSSVTKTTSLSNVNVTFSTAGSSRMLVACIAMTVMGTSGGNSRAPNTAITYNGVGMTLRSQANTGTGGATVYVYTLADPASGSNTFNIQATDDNNEAYQHSAITLISVAGVTGLTATATGAGSASTAVTDDFDSSSGQLVIDGMAQNNGHAISAVGSGQTLITSNVTSSTQTVASSFETASGSATTMSYTMAGSASWAIAGVALTVNTRQSVGLDMIQHKGKLVALIAEEDDQHVFTSSDGVTWEQATTDITAGLLDDTAVSANEDIDAGLLVTTGLGELCAVVWDEDSSTITFFSSTNGGTTWADESTEIPSAGGPKGVVAYPDVDRVTKLYVATQEGIHIVDTSVNPWTTEFIYPMTYHENNGRRMVVHGGSIWFAQGVDADTPAPIYRLTVSGDRRVIESGYGLNQGDGVPGEMHGSINYMKSAGDFLFASVGGHDGDGNRFSRVICHNGLGWHHMTEYQTTDKPIEWIEVGSGDDKTPKLHYGIRTGSAASDARVLIQPLVNPRSQVEIKREDDSSGVTGYVDLPYIDLGMPHESKNFLRAHINGEDLNSSASDEYITVQYGTDDAARTATTLGSFTSATTVNTFQSNAGESAKNIGMRVNLLRGSTNTNTPILKDLIVEGMVVPGNGNLMYQHEMIIDIDQTADMLGLNTETVYSNLKTLLATVTQVDLEFGSESRKVTVDRESSQFHTYLDGEASSSAPNGLAIRKGKLRLILTERIPLS